MEVRTTILQQADRFAIQDDALDRKARHRDAKQGEVLGPIAPGARPQVHEAILAPGDEAIAIPLEFVKPLRPGRDLVSQDRLTWSNEALRLTPVAGTNGTPTRD